MAAVLTESEAAVAAPAADGSMVRFSFPIEKSVDTKDINPVDGTPDIEIWGKVTDGTVDSDQQIVDPEASLRWIRRWYDTRANIRMGHDPKKPIGRGLEVDGHYVKALIAEPVAKHLIRTKVLQDWSVGIMNPDIRKNDPRFRHLDPLGKAVNGVITDRPDGLTELGEISAVDRGANYGTSFQMVKAAAGGTAEWVGRMIAPDEVLAGVPAPKARAPRAYKTVSVELPRDMKLPVTPAILAKMQTMAQRNAVAASDVTKVAEPVTASEPGGEPAVKAAVADAVPADDALKAIGEAEDSVLGKGSRTFTAEQRREHASAGNALADGSYPMPDADAVRRAAILIRSKHGKWKAAAKLLARRVKELGIPNPLKTKIRNPQAGKVAGAEDPAEKAAKCGKCMGKGMISGVPCASCKKGAKRARKMSAATVAAPDAVKKSKVMCPGCGARQNSKHAMCSECGRSLAGAVPVTKNHDFTCLGCGNTPLDKGEKYCPACGKENPGYLEVADKKIPMNMDAGKAAAGEDRVPDLTTKAKKAPKKKAGKKGKDGKKLPPWLKPKDGDGDADGTAKATGPQAAKGRKGGKKKGGMGRSPAVGDVAQETMGVPAHREPDGAPVEAFEADLGIDDGDCEMKTAMRHKSLGCDPQLAVLHDLTCPAFSPEDVSKSLPHASYDGIDDSYWQAKALDAAAGGDMATAMTRWNEYAALSRHAVTLKTADPQVIHDLRLEGHAAFLEANKAFRDATPGPGSFPTPGHVTPGRFQHPYLSAGHAAPSPQHAAPHSFAGPEGTPVAAQFGHGYLTDGRATDSPANQTPRPMPQPASMEAGRPESVHYEGTMRDNARQAISAMHDHVSRIFPDVCPMSPAMGHTQMPGHPVPEAVGGPVPGKKAGKAAKTKAERKADKAKAAAKAATRAAAKASKSARAQARKAAAVTAPQPAPVQPAAPEPADLIRAAVTEATTALRADQKALRKAMKAQAKVLDAIAGQRDTTGAPFRGAGVAKTAMTSVTPAGPQTAAESAEQAQTAKLQRLYKEWRTTTIPEHQEAAWQEIQAMLGTQPLTGYDNGPVPMRRPPVT